MYRSLVFIGVQSNQCILNLLYIIFGIALDRHCCHCFKVFVKIKHSVAKKKKKKKKNISCINCEYQIFCSKPVLIKFIFH